MSALELLPISFGKASDWIRGSLSEGSDLSTLVGRRLNELANAVLIGPPGSSDLPLTNGIGVQTADSDAAVEQLLEFIAAASTAKSIVVEDDLARRGDPNLDVDVAFVGDRVVRWCGLEGNVRAAARLLRTGSAGYPLLAFVSSLRCRELPLAPGRTLNGRNIQTLADSVCAVITTVFDAESFLALTATHLRA